MTILELIEETTMAAYWIAHVEVSDPDVYGEYAKLFEKTSE